MSARRAATVMERTTFVGVSALAEETGLSQGYVSKLLGWGCSEDEVRERAELAAVRRDIRAMRMAGRRPVGRRHR